MQTMDNELFFSGILIESGETMDASYTEKVKDGSTFKKVIEWVKQKARQILEGVKKVISGISNRIKNIGMIVRSFKLSRDDSNHVKLTTKDQSYNKKVMEYYQYNVSILTDFQSTIKSDLMKLKAAHDEAVLKGCEKSISEIETKVGELKKEYEEGKKLFIESEKYAQNVQRMYVQISKPISENARQLGRYLSEYVKQIIKALSVDSKNTEEYEKAKTELRFARVSLALQARILRILIKSAILSSVKRFFKFPSRKVKA